MVGALAVLTVVSVASCSALGPGYSADTATLEDAFPVLTEYSVEAIWIKTPSDPQKHCRVLAYAEGAYATGVKCPDKFRGVPLDFIEADDVVWDDFDAIQDAIGSSGDELTLADIEYDPDGSLATGEFVLDDDRYYFYEPGYGTLEYDSIKPKPVNDDWYVFE